MDGVGVQLEGQGFEEGNVIGHHFLIGEVKFVHDDGVDVVVTQQIIFEMDTKQNLLNILAVKKICSYKVKFRS